MKHIIVFNEKAGANSGTEDFKAKVNEAFKGLDFELYATKGPKDATKFVKGYCETNKDVPTRFYACGGDGTINEVANGLVGYKNVELAIYASGTGNDFVKIYANTREYDQIVKEKLGQKRFLDFNSLINGKATPIDITEVTGESLEGPMYSVNVVNLGFDAIVGAKGNENKLAGKKDPYGFTQAILPAILHGRFNKIIITADGEQLNPKKLLLCSISQGQWVGGEYWASPRSDNTDGQFDVIVMKTMGLFPLLLKYFDAYKHGQTLDNPKKYNKIIYKRAKEVTIVSPDTIDICVDGEIVNGKSFSLKCLPGAIKLVIPQ